MDIDFSKIFHQHSKTHLRNHSPIPEDYDEWPDEWKTTYYKTYPRLPSIALGNESPPSADFFELIQKRSSRRNFARAVITKQELSLLLKYSCGNTGAMENGRHHRAQASGGGLFPIEVYPIIFRESADLPAGLYHYSVKNHALDVLWQRDFSDDDVRGLFTYPWVVHATLALVMTAVFSRTQDKYGERGYRYILIETGHIGQNLYLAAETLGLKCCTLGGTRDENLEKLIDIDGISESVVYGAALGK